MDKKTLCLLFVLFLCVLRSRDYGSPKRKSLVNFETTRTYTFTVVVYKKKYLKRRMAYSAGHSGTFNPAVITNQEAHMMFGNMDSGNKSSQKNGGKKRTITTFFKKNDLCNSGE